MDSPQCWDGAFSYQRCCLQSPLLSELEARTKALQDIIIFSNLNCFRRVPPAFRDLAAKPAKGEGGGADGQIRQPTMQTTKTVRESLCLY